MPSTRSLKQSKLTAEDGSGLGEHVPHDPEAVGGLRRGPGATSAIPIHLPPVSSFKVGSEDLEDLDQLRSVMK